jgi:hypothetical protein
MKSRSATSSGPRRARGSTSRASGSELAYDLLFEAPVHLVRFGEKAAKRAVTSRSEGAPVVSLLVPLIAEGVFETLDIKF